MSTSPNRKMTPAEYLEADRNSDKRNIFFRGEVFAMTGARRPHILIAGNTYAELHSQLKDRSCEVYMADMRVKNNRTGSYFYPDISVTCESPKFEDGGATHWSIRKSLLRCCRSRRKLLTAGKNLMTTNCWSPSKITC